MSRIPQLALALVCLVPASLAAQDFTYNPPGALQSGTAGLVDDTVFVPGMRYPLEASPSYPNSQVWGVGGSKGPSGSECDSANYSYPWWDNYCEPRTWTMPLCPGGTGHQGQDIRPATCADNVHWAVAAEAGTITKKGSYSLYLTTAAGVLHRYLHMEPSSISVKVGNTVNKGDKLGRVSDTFFDSDGKPVGTTWHLHYDIRMYVQSEGANIYVPPYMSLVKSYEELLGVEATPCAVLGPDGGVIDNSGPCFLKWGNSKYWRDESGAGVGGELLWTNAFDSDTPGNWARWKIELEKGGEYHVEVHVVSPWNKSKKVPYAVVHNGKEKKLALDQSAGDGWRPLGTYVFAAGGDQYVDVYDNSGETADDLHITVDAIRLLPVEDPVDPPVEPEDPPVEPEDPPVEPEDPPVEPEGPPVEPLKCPPLPGHGGDIDDTAPCFTVSGELAWAEDAGGEGGQLHWTTAGTKGATAKWTTGLAAAGWFDVMVNVTGEHSGANRAWYVAFHNNKVAGVRLDQGAQDGWRLVGHWFYAAENEQWLELSAETSQAAGAPIVADAVRLVPAVPGPVEGAECTPIAAEGGTVDDAGPCATLFGANDYWRVEADLGTLSSMHWTNAFAGTAPSNKARWDLPMAQGGTYEIQVRVVAPFNRSTAVPYVLSAGGQTFVALLNQAHGDGWRKLGVWDFDMGYGQYIEVLDNTGEEGTGLSFTVDAIRLVLRDGPPTGAVEPGSAGLLLTTETTPQDKEASASPLVGTDAGCSHGSRGGSSPAVALLILLLIAGLARAGWGRGRFSGRRTR